MTSDQRFTLLMFGFGVLVAVIGWYGRRIMNSLDKRWAIVDAIAAQNTIDTALKPEWEKRQERTESAIAKLLEIVTEQGLQFARHEGYHESHDKSDSPLLG